MDEQHNNISSNSNSGIDPLTPNKRANRTSYMVTPKLPDSEEISSSSPKTKPSTFLSFFTRRGGKTRPLASINIAHVDDHPQESSPRSPTFRNPFSPTSSSPLKTTPLPSTNSLPIEIPALYVAYPQAIRAAILAATAVSPEVILRRNSDAQVVKDAASKPPRKGMLHRQTHSVKADTEWTRKLFVLTPGSLLQFSADGAVDRLPEKVLQLTSQSVAFASDALPGRPYVLQVSQISDSGGILVPPAEKKSSLFSKLTSSKPPASSVSKYTTSALLLVFEGAREMEQWMSSIRTEATKLAGNYVPTEDDEEDEHSNGSSSRRHVIRRYPIRPPPEPFSSISVSGSSTSKRTSRMTHISRRSIETDPSVITSSSEHLGTSYEYTGPSNNHSRSKLNDLSTSSNTPDRTSSSEETLQDTAVANRRQSMQALSLSRSSMELRPPLRPLSTISAGSRGSSDYRRREGGPASLSTGKRYSHHSTHSSTPLSASMHSSSPNLPAAISTSSSANGSTPPLPADMEIFTRPPRMPSFSNNNSTTSIPSSSNTHSTHHPYSTNSTNSNHHPHSSQTTQKNHNSHNNHINHSSHNIPKVSKPLPNPASPAKVKRPRPASMFDKALPPPPGSNSRSPTQQYNQFRSISTAGIPQMPLPVIPTTKSPHGSPSLHPTGKSPSKHPKNLQRRSMTALQVNLASGHFRRDPQGQFVPTPPAFPPPSCPLPKIPPLELARSTHIVVPKKSSPCLGFNATRTTTEQEQEEDDIVVGLGIFHEDEQISNNQSHHHHTKRTSSTRNTATRSRSVKERRLERKMKEDARKSFNLVGRWRDTGMGGYGSADERDGSDVSAGSTECVIGI